MSEEEFDPTMFPVIVVAWHQEGCPACEAFLPTFRAVAAKYAACVPSAVLDANEYTDLADGYWVRATPTVHILRYGRRSPYVLGMTDAESLERMYETVLRGMALHGNACEIA